MLLAIVLFAIYCIFVSCWFDCSEPEIKITKTTKPESVFPEQVFELLDAIEIEKTELYDPWYDPELGQSEPTLGFYLVKKWNHYLDFNPNTKLMLPAPKPAVNIKSMSFNSLRKAASKLRDAGYFQGKIRGKGVNQTTLSQKIESILSNHADAAQILA